MVEIIIRKISRMGDECVAVDQQELPRRLHAELKAGYFAALKSDIREARFIGNSASGVLEKVREEMDEGAKRIEVLLIPPVVGG